jgi:transcriptional regulator with XRE-family HTH domain
LHTARGSTALDRTFTSLLERGLRTPTLTVFCTIAERLDVPPAELQRDTVANFERRRTQSG